MRFYQNSLTEVPPLDIVSILRKYNAILLQQGELAFKYQAMLIGVYNGAILYSQHRMTPENLKVFYHQLQQQMLAALKLEAELQLREMARAQTEAACAKRFKNT